MNQRSCYTVWSIGRKVSSRKEDENTDAMSPASLAVASRHLKRISIA